MQLIFIIQLLLGIRLLQAAILPLTLNKDNDRQNLPLDTDKFGYVELKPNGTLILRRKPNQNGNNLENLLLLRGALHALKLAPVTPQMAHEGNEASKLNIKIYGEGVEHKFPPLVENIIQRIQTYFSIYRYTDTSRPIRKDELIPQASQIQVTEEIHEEVTATTVKSEEVTENEQPVTVDPKDTYITVGESGE